MSEPGVEAVEARHFEGGIKHPSVTQTSTIVYVKEDLACFIISQPQCKPDGLLHRLADDVGGGSGLRERRQVDDPFDGFVVFAAGAQQVEQSGEENHLHGSREHTSALEHVRRIKTCSWA